jgi:hypothetical protein
MIKLCLGLLFSVLLGLGSAPDDVSGDAWLEYSEVVSGRQDPTVIFLAAALPFSLSSPRTVVTSFDACTDTVTLYLYGDCLARACEKADLTFRTTGDDRYGVLHWRGGGPPAPWGAAGSQYAWVMEEPQTALTLYLSSDGCH